MASDQPTTAAKVPDEWRWANERYFDMLEDRDRWRQRYITCRDQLTLWRGLVLVASVAAIVGWIR